VQQHGGDAVPGGWWAAMRPLKGTRIVTYHRSWTYFAKRFGLEVIAELEPKPGIEPTPGHLTEVVDKVEQQKARFLLVEPFYSRQAPDWLEKKTGIKIVQVANSVGGQPEATDYISLIDLLVKRCVDAAGAAPAKPAP
jgi:zinc/manganese transport system substrate-binding protein